MCGHTVKEILRLLDAKNNDKNNEIVDDEITIKNKNKDTANDTQMKTQLDNTAILAELMRIRDNYHTLWKQNMDLRERNELLEAQTNSLNDIIDEDQITPQAVSVTIPNAVNFKILRVKR